MTSAMELFIDAVRKYPCLWNTNDKYYRHGEKKEMAWNNIARLNIPEIKDAKTAKVEWKKLRDNHRDSLKRQRSGKSGNWKYAQSMEFLVPYMKQRERSYLTGLEPQDTNSQQSTQGSSSEQPEQGPTQNVLDESMIEESRISELSRKRKNDDDIVDIIRELEANLVRRQQERDIRRIEGRKHPIELFFQSMAETIKTMPTFMQNTIKKKVLQIVCDAEEEHVSCSTTPTSSTATGSQQQLISVKFEDPVA